MSSVKSAQHLAKRTRSGMRDQLLSYLNCSVLPTQAEITLGTPEGVHRQDRKEKGATTLKGAGSQQKKVEVGWEELPMRGGATLTIASFI